MLGNASILTFPDKSKEDSSKLGLFASVIGHVGDGNFHQAVTYEAGNQEQRNTVARCVHTMMERALEMEGTVSVSLGDTVTVWHFTDSIKGEHAIGLGKRVRTDILQVDV